VLAGHLCAERESTKRVFRREEGKINKNLERELTIFFYFNLFCTVECTVITKFVVCIK
jgi:hypothetical protein